ncbi:hypothetical protein AKJ09_04801 [Labilithrix luteola]|uniref:Uncharacterized protein n=2 Tax=Labilithrix luteola TaxID=1391654 RepID=A0A0K1PX91_9BACT|nr:hypothetical protein AKJ09_04801 [Labilithrix luteola]
MLGPVIGPRLRLAFAALRWRLVEIGGDVPVRFFVIVLGVVLSCRVAIGWARHVASAPETTSGIAP